MRKMTDTNQVAVVVTSPRLLYVCCMQERQTPKEACENEANKHIYPLIVTTTNLRQYND